MKFKNRIGFSLIEIIVVLVIVGVLAAIALPNLFSWIESSRGSEGLLAIKDCKDQFAACVTIHAALDCANQVSTLCPSTPNFTYSGANTNTALDGTFSLFQLFYIFNNSQNSSAAYSPCNNNDFESTTSSGFCFNYYPNGELDVNGYGYFSGMGN